VIELNVGTLVTQGEEMPDETWALHTWFMMLLGFGITVLLIMGSTTLWKHDIREATLFFTLASGLTLLFYRKRLAVLAACSCAFILVNAGLTAVFHPTAIGMSASVASLAGLIFFSRQVEKQHPGLLPDNWQQVFNKK
jgi:hypothetical protein